MAKAWSGVQLTEQRLLVLIANYRFLVGISMTAFTHDVKRHDYTPSPLVRHSRDVITRTVQQTVARIFVKLTTMQSEPFLLLPFIRVRAHYQAEA